jgi:hypothetical protein
LASLGKTDAQADWTLTAVYRLLWAFRAWHNAAMATQVVFNSLLKTVTLADRVIH